MVANFLKKFNALLSQELPSNGATNLSDSLEIHSNILRFTSNDLNAPLELVYGKLQTGTNVNPSKLKGHNLQPCTMRNGVPSILIQIYANPCLYWLHQPAFYVLLLRLNTPMDKIPSEFARMKSIFASEFVTRKNTNNQDIKEIQDILNSINISENDELANLLLTSILPFIFCYLNVVEVIKDQVSASFCVL